MKITNGLLLRLTVAVILLMHSIPSIVGGGVNEFGELYLNAVGFSPIGLPLAWAIKLSHIFCAVCLVWGKYVRWASLVTIVILVAGIVMIHGREGWYVIGPGRNGMEFSLLLIVVLVTLMFPQGFGRQQGN